MNSLQKVSFFPMRRCMIGAIRQTLPVPAVETTPMRRMGCAHIAPFRNMDIIYEHPNALEIEQVVQLVTPAELKASLGVGTFFAEKKGTEIVAFAATKKLLAEERLRQGLENFKVPLNGIVRKNYRQKPSSYRPVCPVIQEET